MTNTEPKKVLVLGGLSAMAVASTRRLAAHGASFVIAGRKEDQLKREAQDLQVRGAPVAEIQVLDLTDVSACDAMIEAAREALGGLDAVLVFYGVLGDQHEAELNPEHAASIIDINYSSTVHWILAAARALQAHGGPNAVLLTASSVAGDRGRRSNFVYGSAKAGVSVLMQGLAHKWAAMENAPHAVNLKLGFVDTPMTDGVAKSGPLWAKPDTIGALVEKAVMQPGGPVVYGPWFWRWIMMAIRATPALVFNKVNL